MITGLDPRPNGGRVTSVQTINRYVAQILTQWRDGRAAGPLWFGRNRRAEAVILPADLARAVADAAVDSIDLDHCAKLKLRAAAPRLAEAEILELGDVQLQQTCPPSIVRAAVRDLDAIMQNFDAAAVTALAEHLAQGAEAAARSRIDPIGRRVAHTHTATWLTYWHLGDHALVAVIPAPDWLRQLVAIGPEEPAPLRPGSD